MFDSKLKKLGKNVVLGFFAAITLLLTLLCLFNNAYLSWDEHTTIVADKPFYLLLWFIIVLFFVYFVIFSLPGNAFYNTGYLLF